MMIKQSFQLPVRLNGPLTVRTSFGLLFISLILSACLSYPSSQNSNLGGDLSRFLNPTNSSADSHANLPLPPAILPSSSNGIRRVVYSREAIRRIEPVYPNEAKEQNIKGNVAVEIIIDEKGNVESARALSGHEVLKGSAVETALKWKFRVARINGKPVKIRSTLIFSFPPNEKKKA